jgi:hypothetical protein
MGNCCELLDSKFEELLLAEEDLNESRSTLSYSHDQILNISPEHAGLNTSEEKSTKFIRFRNTKNKLNTIIEDKHEDIINSPSLNK